MPTARSASTLRRRSGSRAKMLDRSASTKGMRTASKASRMASEEWVKAAALIRAPSARPASPCTSSTKRPSSLVCCQSSSAPRPRPPPEPLPQLREAAFLVGLLPVQLGAQLPGPLADRAFEVAERRRPVDLGFPGAQQIEIGSVEDGEAHYDLRPLSQRLK